MQKTMQKTMPGLFLAFGVAVLSFAPDSLAQQTTVRTGPNGNTQTTTRTVGNGQQTTVRTGANGNTQTTTRTVGNGQQTTVRTGPNGNTQTTTRSVHR